MPLVILIAILALPAFAPGAAKIVGFLLLGGVVSLWGLVYFGIACNEYADWKAKRALNSPGQSRGSSRPA